MSRLKELKNYVAAESWFHCDDEEDNRILFATRENGNVYNESAGRKDINEAIRLKNAIRKKYPNEFEFEIETVDEWVHLTVSLQKEKEYTYSYAISRYYSDTNWLSGATSYKAIEEFDSFAREVNYYISDYDNILEKTTIEELIAKLDSMEFNGTSHWNGWESTQGIAISQTNNPKFRPQKIVVQKMRIDY
jgi:hypothetical protein